MGFWWVLRFALYPASVKIPVDTTFFHFKLVGHSIVICNHFLVPMNKAASPLIFIRVLKSP